MRDSRSSHIIKLYISVSSNIQLCLLTQQKWIQHIHSQRFTITAVNLHFFSVTSKYNYFNNYEYIFYILHKLTNVTTTHTYCEISTPHLIIFVSYIHSFWQLCYLVLHPNATSLESFHLSMCKQIIIKQ